MPKHKAHPRRKPKAAKIPIAPPVVVVPEVVVVAVPLEKTRDSMWQQFVDWLKT